jgi:hypothetical protein
MLTFVDREELSRDLANGLPKATSGSSGVARVGGDEFFVFDWSHS